MKSKFNVLEPELEITKKVTDNLIKYIKTVERKCHKNEQYSKRECLEISCIPNSIEDTALKYTAMKLFRKVNVLIDPLNVGDCYHLKSNNNGPQKVINKLFNEKRFNVFSRLNRALKMLILPKMELQVKVYVAIINSYGQNIKKLWLNKVIESFCVSKGSCRIRLIGNLCKIITYIDDLKNLFPGNPALKENASSS